MQDAIRNTRPHALAQTVLVFIASAVLFGWTMDRLLNLYDEGIILTGAARVLAGEIPHRDFYANYGPAQFYLLAGLFQVFGKTVLVERVLDVAVRAAIVAACFAIVRGHAKTVAALACALVCALWLLAVSFPGYPMFPAILLLLIAVPSVARALGGAGTRGSLVLAGALMGLAALFRYDVGVAAFGAALVAVALQAARSVHGTGTRVRRVLSSMWPLVAGLAVVCMPVALAYLAVAPLEAFVHDIIGYPTQHYVRMRSLPFPSLLEAPVVYLPPLICAAGAWSLLASPPEGTDPIARAVPGSVKRAAKVALLLFTVVLYAKGLVRMSDIHIIGAILASTVLLALLVADGRNLGGARFATSLVLASALVVVTSGSAIGALQARVATQSLLGPYLFFADANRPTPPHGARCELPIELRTIDCFWPGGDSAQAALFLARRTARGERIFVGASRHDTIFANDMSLYFAADRLPATRWAHFDPGLQNTETVQRDIIDELRANKVRFVVLSSAWDGMAEPNESATSSGVRLLDDYLRSDYQPVETFGYMTIMMRRD